MFNHTQELDKLATALCAFHKTGKGVKQDSVNENYDSRYASLDGIISAVRESLAEVGLSIVQLPAVSQGHRIVIETGLLHTSGQFLSLEGALPLDTNSDIQRAASGFTYLRRYALKGLLMLPDVDDDGNAAARRPRVPVATVRGATIPAESVDALPDGPAPEPIRDDNPAPMPSAGTQDAGDGWDADPHEDDEKDMETGQGTDFRETRIHFGKNRGLMLSELTPQQVHWYESDWMPKKEVNGPTSPEDLALIQALKAYRSWRGAPAPRPDMSKVPILEVCTEERARELGVPEAEVGMAWARTYVPSGKNKNSPLGNLDDDAIGAYYKLMEDKPELEIFTEKFMDALAGWKVWCNEKAERAKKVAEERAAKAKQAITPEQQAAQDNLKKKPIAKRPPKPTETPAAVTTPPPPVSNAGGAKSSAGGASWKDYPLPIGTTHKGKPLGELPKSELEEIKREYIDTRKWNEPAKLKPFDADLKKAIEAGLAWTEKDEDGLGRPTIPPGPVADLYARVEGMIIDPNEFVLKLQAVGLIPEAEGNALEELSPALAEKLLADWDKTVEAFDSNMPWH